MKKSIVLKSLAAVMLAAFTVGCGGGDSIPEEKPEDKSKMPQKGERG